MMPSSEDLLFTIFQLCAQTQDITRLSGTVAYVCMTNSILIFFVYCISYLLFVTLKITKIVIMFSGRNIGKTEFLHLSVCLNVHNINCLNMN